MLLRSGWSDAPNAVQRQLHLRKYGSSADQQRGHAGDGRQQSGDLDPRARHRVLDRQGALAADELFELRHDLTARRLGPEQQASHRHRDDDNRRQREQRIERQGSPHAGARCVPARAPRRARRSATPGGWCLPWWTVAGDRYAVNGALATTFTPLMTPVVALCTCSTADVPMSPAALRAPVAAAEAASAVSTPISLAP